MPSGPTKLLPLALTSIDRISLTPSGFMASLATKTQDELAAARAVFPHHFGGVEQSEAMLRWIWDHFAYEGVVPPARGAPRGLGLPDRRAF